MASWATPDDVTGSWIGEGAPTNTALVQKWIDRAEREIRFRVPDLQARVEAEANLTPAKTDLMETVIDAAVAMVTRVFRNPDGIRQTNVTTGPMTASKTFGGDTPGALALTSDELAKLQGVKTSGAFTVSMIPASSPFYVG